MAPTIPTINYGYMAGIRSQPAAITLMVVYVFLCALFARFSLKHRYYVYFTLASFCNVRLTAFVLRTIVTSSQGASENQNMIISTQAIYSLGFFSLLYGCYRLLLQRINYVRPYIPKFYANSHITKWILRFIMFVAVVVGVCGTSLMKSTDPDTKNLSQNLRNASMLIFSSCTMMLVLLVMHVTWATLDIRKRVFVPIQVGPVYTLLLASLFLLVRQLFLVCTYKDVATRTDPLTRQATEALFYPLVVLPEIIALLLLALPGVVETDVQAEKEGQVVAEEFTRSLDRERRSRSGTPGSRRGSRATVGTERDVEAAVKGEVAPVDEVHPMTEVVSDAGTVVVEAPKKDATETPAPPEPAHTSTAPEAPTSDAPPKRTSATPSISDAATELDNVD
ncbi:hypothetical protein HK104_002298 [Borealophlyctis nickersoniae]|nr:hypothetical protein HK104_002298 [Borealophlyctis nickersoniae]